MNYNRKTQTRSLEIVFEVENINKLRQEQDLFFSTLQKEKEKRKISFFDGKLCLINNRYQIFAFIQLFERYRIETIISWFAFKVLDYNLPGRNKYVYYTPEFWNHLSSIPINGRTYGSAKIGTKIPEKDIQKGNREIYRELYSRITNGDITQWQEVIREYPELIGTKTWMYYFPLLRLNYLREQLRYKEPKGTCITYIFGEPGWGKSYFADWYAVKEYQHRFIHNPMKNWEWLDGLNPEHKCIVFKETKTKNFPFYQFKHLWEKGILDDEGYSGRYYQNIKFGHTEFLGEHMVFCALPSPFGITLYHSENATQTLSSYYQVWRIMAGISHLNDQTEDCICAVIWLHKSYTVNEKKERFYFPLEVTEKCRDFYTEKIKTKLDSEREITSYDIKRIEKEFRSYLLNWKEQLTEDEKQGVKDKEVNSWIKKSLAKRKKINKPPTEKEEKSEPKAKKKKKPHEEKVSSDSYWKLKKDLSVEKTNGEEIQRFINQASSLAIDLETTGETRWQKNNLSEDSLNWQKNSFNFQGYSSLRTIQFSDGRSAYYIVVENKDKEFIIKNFLGKIKNKQLIFHNWKFDFRVLKNTYNYDLRKFNNTFEDTYLIAKALDARGGEEEYSLGKLADRYWITNTNWKGIILSLKKKLKLQSLSEVYKNINVSENRDFIQYALLDAFYTKLLFNRLQEELMGIEEWEIYKGKLSDSLLSFSEEEEGIGFDLRRAEEEIKKQSKKQEEIHDKFIKLNSIDEGQHKACFLKSTIKLNTWLQKNFDLRHLNKLGRTKKKLIYHTQGDSLQELLPHEGINLLLQYRNKEKILGFWKEFKEQAAKDKKHRLYPNYNVFGTRTGRWTAENPNIQQVPEELKKALDFDYTIDFDQQELRMMALISKDKALTEIFQTGADFHSMIAKELNCERKLAKIINYALPYNIGRKNFFHLLKKEGKVDSLEKSNLFYEKWWKKFPTLKKVVWKTNEIGKAVSEINSRIIRTEKNFKTWNYLIQGSCSDLFTLVWRRLREIRGIKICGKIHDEFLIKSKLPKEVLKKEVDKLEYRLEGINFPLQLKEK